MAFSICTDLIAELEQLHHEIVELVKPLSDTALWHKPVAPGNSIGHLILHLTGNLKHFIGAQLGGSGYVRDRDREFTEKTMSTRVELMAGLEDAVGIFHKVVSGLTPEQLAATHPTEKFGSVQRALVHLVAHFASHRGQMSYLARMV